MKYITYLLLLCSLVSFAQRGNYGGGKPPMVSLSGKVIEANTKQALEYATVVLTHLKTKRVTGGITDAKGNFSIQVPKGMYGVSVEFIGFKTKKLANQKLGKNTNLGTIALAEDSETLETVEVIAEKSTVEIRLDKKIYNVGKDMTVKGGNASDVLDNVPSVNVDAEGAVSLRGNENVRILIDGKPSALVGLNGTEALRNLPSDAIEKVEVITSPSARYDAEGTAGILNIILRKGKITGFNGSVNLTVGDPEMLRIAPNLNFRTKKFNLFSNLGYSYRKGPGNSQTFFTNYDKNTGAIKDYRNEDRVFDRTNKGFNGNIGMEYYLTKNSSLTGSFFYRKSDGEDIATNITDKFDVNRIITSTSTRVETEKDDSTNKQFSLNYTNNFDGNGKKLIIDFQYGDSDSVEDSPISVDGVVEELNSQITNITDQLYQIDYIHPLNENSQLEFGHKTTLEDMFSDFKVRDENGVINTGLSNAINFKQNIYAFYAQYGNKANKLTYLLGLRSEITDIDLELITTNTNTEKNYTEWFPTVNLGYEVNDNDNFTLGYSRRIRRPRHWFINPFESRSSDTNIFQGNPDVNPMFTNSFDLGYTTKISKFNLGASVYYQKSTDVMSVVSLTEDRIITGETDPVAVTIRRPINLDGEQRYGFEFTTNYNPTRKIRLSASFNYFQFKTDPFSYTYTASNGLENTETFNEVNANSWFARFNSRITLPWKIQWQTRLMYRAPQDSAQGTRDNMLVANIALSKDLFKDKATLVLNTSDLFNSRKRESITRLYQDGALTQIADGSFQWRERQISLSFTYRFNQKKKRERPQRGGYDGGGEDFGG